MAHQFSEDIEQGGPRRALLARLPAPWTLLNDTPWPGRTGCVLDLAIGPSGLFVIVDAGDPGEALAASEAVASLVPGLAPEHVLGVLATAAGPVRPGAGEPTLDSAADSARESPWAEVDGAIVCDELQLARLLRALPRVLTSEQVAGVVSVIHVALERVERAHDQVPVARARTQGLIADVRASEEVRRRLRHRRPRGAHRGGA